MIRIISKINIFRVNNFRGVTSNQFSTVASKLKEEDRNNDSFVDTHTKPKDWDTAKPFHEIPGPKGLPVIGNLWRFFPVIGEYHGLDSLAMVKKLNNEYGGIATLGNLFGDKTIFLFDSDSYETFYRNEGPWPTRYGMESLTYYRKNLRKDVFVDGVSGLSTVQGKEWYDFRQKANPLMMQPARIASYATSIDEVTCDLVKNVRELSLRNKNGEMPEDFINEIYKWGLETVCMFALDTRLGCLSLDLDVNSEQQKLINSILDMFELSQHFDNIGSLIKYEYISTPTWKKYIRSLDFITDTAVKYITLAKERIDKADNQSTDNKSVLQSLLEVNTNYANAMAIDLIGGGVDTTGRIMGSTLYFIAKYPEVQAKLREELLTLMPDKNSQVTNDIINRAPYLKAVVKETLRLSPITFGTARNTVKDLVLGGYQIPKGTRVVTGNLLQCHSNDTFPEAMQYKPERFLRSVNNEYSYKNANQFIYKPFGFGPRTCIGMRLATMELEIGIAKLVRNFEFSWPHEDMIFKMNFFYGIGSPLKLHVKEAIN